MAAPVTLTVDARGTIPKSIIRAAEGLPDDMAHMESMDIVPVDPASIPPESRCNCCPYGYHIDLDFLRYCESLNNGSYLRNLKKIKRNKRKLRKSMEVYLNNQQQGIEGPPPPDVVHSTDHFMNFIEHENQTSKHILDDIDNTMDNFDLINHPKKRAPKGSGDYDDLDSYYDYSGDYDSGSPSPGTYNRNPHYPHHRDPQKFRTETEMVLHHRPMGKSDSISSLTSSVSEPLSHPSSGGEYKTTVTETEKHYSTQTHTYITSAQLAGQFANLNQEVLAIEGHDDRANITPEALKAIREQMAASLQRLRELEEQVKLIPVLQVRLQVLKEEKRLQDLQVQNMQAKNQRPRTRTVGVGDCRVDDYYDKPDGRSQSSSPSTRMFEMTQFQSYNRNNMRRPSTRSVGVGDGNVFEQFQIVQKYNGYQDNSLRERELHTEESSHVSEKEKEVHTLVIGQEQNRLGNLRKTEHKVPTRSIGVGSGNVFEKDSNIHVHEKEMRTVIIGGKDQTKKSHRNVGVSCRATMRDVGVMYYYEDVKPLTRNVAVGVGEGMMVGEFGEGGGDGHTSVHQTLTSLQQMNLAAFHSRNINIKTEHLRIILDEMLKKDVHSVGTMCKMSTEDKATTHDYAGADLVSVGCGSDSVDVEVREVKATRSVGVESKPTVASKALSTDIARTSDIGVNTQRSQIVHRATNTQGVTTFPATTNTEPIRTYAAQTETDRKIFQALDQIKHTATNTNVVRKMNSETNTEHPGRKLNTFAFNTDITFVDKGVNTTTMKHTINRSVNTDQVRLANTGVGDFNINQHVDCDICLVKPKTKTVGMTTTQEQVVQDDQRLRSEVTRHVSSTPAGYTREVTVQSKVGGGPGMQITKEITKETKVRGRQRSRSPNNLTQQQIMEQHLGMGNLEQTTQQLMEDQMKGFSETTTTEEVVQRSSTGGGTLGGGQHVTKEIFIEGRTGRGLEGLGGRTGGGYTREVVETRRVGGVGDSGQHVTKEITITGGSGRPGGGRGGYQREVVETRTSSVPERTSSSTVTEEVVEKSIHGGTRLVGGHDYGHGGGRGGYQREVIETRTSSVPQSTSSSTVTEEIVEKTVRGGSRIVGGQDYGGSGGLHITREVTVGGRAGGLGGLVEGAGRGGYQREVVETRTSSVPQSTSSSTVTEEVVEKTIRSGSSFGDQGGSGGGLHITREVTVGGRSGLAGGLGSPGSSSSSSSSFKSVLQKETPGGVIVETKPSREERMKAYGVGSTKIVGASTTTEEKIIKPRVGISTSSSSSSSGSTSMSATSSSAISAEQEKDTEVQFIPDGKGGTQMRVVRHTETSYVGNQPVHSQSDVVLAEGAISGHSQEQQHQHQETYSSSASSSSRSSSNAGQLQQGIISSSSSSSSAGGSSTGGSGGFTSTRTVTTQKPAGRSVTVTETKIERRAQGYVEDDGSGNLKSIMKKPGTSPVPVKKEIKFAEEVSGGRRDRYRSSYSRYEARYSSPTRLLRSYVTSSSSESEAEAEEGARSDSDSHSSESVSFDEGSYDGRLGNIVYQCKDDEAIAQGAPGAAMFDQNIRETFELDSEMKGACGVYAKWLEDSTQVNTRELNSSMNRIQQEWFKVSSQKLSNPSQVEDSLSSIKEISPDLLAQVVNMTDANGNSALHYAVSHCNTDIVNLLLDSESTDVDKQNKAGYTAIMLSSLAQVQTEQQRAVVKRLFEMGDVNARASQAGQTALMLAVSHGRMDMVRMLLDANAAVNLQDDDGSTALMCACEHGHTEIVKMLLSHPDCDPTVADNDGSTALSIAMEAGHRDVGVLLYAHVNFKQGSPVIRHLRRMSLDDVSRRPKDDSNISIDFLTGSSNKSWFLLELNINGRLPVPPPQVLK